MLTPRQALTDVDDRDREVSNRPLPDGDTINVFSDSVSRGTASSHAAEAASIAEARSPSASTGETPQTVQNVDEGPPIDRAEAL